MWSILIVLLDTYVNYIIIVNTGVQFIYVCILNILYNLYYSVHCTLYTVQCTVYSVQCTVYSRPVRSIQLLILHIKYNTYLYFSIICINNFYKKIVTFGHEAFKV